MSEKPQSEPKRVKVALHSAGFAIGLIAFLVVMAWGAWSISKAVGGLIGPEMAPFALIVLTVITFGSFYHGKTKTRLERIEQRVEDLHRVIRDEIERAHADD